MTRANDSAKRGGMEALQFVSLLTARLPHPRSFLTATEILAGVHFR